MPHSKIQFDEDDYKSIMLYKESSGISLQKFVTEAIKEKLIKIEAEQYIKDLPYLKKP
jgi:hypothetical protein